MGDLNSNNKISIATSTCNANSVVINSEIRAGKNIWNQEVDQEVNKAAGWRASYGTHMENCISKY